MWSHPRAAYRSSPPRHPQRHGRQRHAQVNLGVKFQASAAGTISGIRYYKSSTDTGTHTGTLWSSTGTLLATGTFTGETASGWQTLTFASPVTIAAGTTYVASYHSNGHYIANSNYFTTAKTNGPLTALANATSSNGVYTYGTGNLFPTSTFGAANYWVDVLYQGGSANNPPVAVAEVGPQRRNRARPRCIEPDRERHRCER